MNPTNNKRLENLIYAGLWMVAVILFVLGLMRERSYTDLPLFDAGAAWTLAQNLLPFMLLFAINNYLLIPRLLKRGHYGKYLVSAICAIALVWMWQHLQFHYLEGFEYAPDYRHKPPHPGPHPPMPLPIFMNVIYDLLIVGMNLAVSLLFQQFATQFQHESLMKENAENQLTYLKAQINPHFYMNMLNNIHGMIEIDAERAQEMVIDMSSLMRYMLYDSSRAEIELSAEIKFIKDYLALMRVRYPEDMVSIYSKLPEPHEVAGVKAPPLLFLVFLENAFKHGISYASESFVSVSLSYADGMIAFQCMNSMHPATADKHREGIGLENIKRRLDIIYGKNYSLAIDQANAVYTVTLTLPPYETKDPDN